LALNHNSDLGLRNNLNSRSGSRSAAALAAGTRTPTIILPTPNGPIFKATELGAAKAPLDQLPATTVVEPQERDPLSELEVITTLYFPELKSEVDGYLDRCRARKTEALTITESVTSKMVLEDLKSAREKLSAATQSLTTQIMGVTG
jgi:hypothetical protein